MELLTNSEIARIRDYLEEFKEETTRLRSDLTEIIRSFESNEVVQSLYESGKFGQEEEEKIRKIKIGVDEYCNILMGEKGLMNETTNYLDTQEQYNNKESGGEN